MPAGALEVTLITAKAKPSNGRDVFGEIKLGKAKHRVPVPADERAAGLRAKKVKLTVAGSDKGPLVIEIYAEDAEDELIGRAELPLAKLDQLESGRAVKTTLACVDPKNKAKKVGDVKIELTWQEDAGAAGGDDNEGEEEEEDEEEDGDKDNEEEEGEEEEEEEEEEEDPSPRKPAAKKAAAAAAPVSARAGATGGGSSGGGAPRPATAGGGRTGGGAASALAVKPLPTTARGGGLPPLPPGAKPERGPNPGSIADGGGFFQMFRSMGRMGKTPQRIHFHFQLRVTNLPPDTSNETLSMVLTRGRHTAATKQTGSIGSSAEWGTPCELALTVYRDSNGRYDQKLVALALMAKTVGAGRLIGKAAVDVGAIATAGPSAGPTRKLLALTGGPPGVAAVLQVITTCALGDGPPSPASSAAPSLAGDAPRLGRPGGKEGELIADLEEAHAQLADANKVNNTLAAAQEKLEDKLRAAQADARAAKSEAASARAAAATAEAEVAKLLKQRPADGKKGGKGVGDVDSITARADDLAAQVEDLTSRLQAATAAAAAPATAAASSGPLASAREAEVGRLRTALATEQGKRALELSELKKLLLKSGPGGPPPGRLDKELAKALEDRAAARAEAAELNAALADIQEALAESQEEADGLRAAAAASPPLSAVSTKDKAAAATIAALQSELAALKVGGGKSDASTAKGGELAEARAALASKDAAIAHLKQEVASLGTRLVDAKRKQKTAAVDDGDDDGEGEDEDDDGEGEEGGVAKPKGGAAEVERLRAALATAESRRLEEVTALRKALMVKRGATGAADAAAAIAAAEQRDAALAESAALREELAIAMEAVNEAEAAAGDGGGGMESSRITDLEADRDDAREAAEAAQAIADDLRAEVTALGDEITQLKADVAQAQAQAAAAAQPPPPVGPAAGGTAASRQKLAAAERAASDARAQVDDLMSRLAAAEAAVAAATTSAEAAEAAAAEAEAERARLAVELAAADDKRREEVGALRKVLLKKGGDGGALDAGAAAALRSELAEAKRVAEAATAEAARTAARTDRATGGTAAAAAEARAAELAADNATLAADNESLAGQLAALEIDLANQTAEVERLNAALDAAEADAGTGAATAAEAASARQQLEDITDRYAQMSMRYAEAEAEREMLAGELHMIKRQQAAAVAAEAAKVPVKGKKK